MRSRLIQLERTVSVGVLIVTGPVAGGIKTEIKDIANGTFDAFEALGQNDDWQKTNGEKQLNTLVDIRSLPEQQNGDYI